MIAGVFDIPGYREAVVKERQIRDAAFLPVNEKVAGFEVVPMTLQQFDTLRFVENSLLSSSAIPSPLEIVSFLWMLNPRYKVGVKPPPWFLKQCRFFIPPTAPLLKTKLAMVIHERKTAETIRNAIHVIAQCREYVEESTMDFPSGGGKSVKSYYSDVAGLCHVFAREYGWTDEKTLNTPIKRLLQFINAMKEGGDKASVSNPSDRILGAWISEKNRRSN